MSAEQFEAIRAFEELESLRMAGTPIDDVTDRELAADLALIQALEHHARDSKQTRIPDPDSFSHDIITKLRPDRYWWGYLVTAAVLLLAAYINFRPNQTHAPLFIDRDMLQQAMAADAREAMVDYLIGSEKLLMSLREPDLICLPDKVDMVSETELAKDLLVRQKAFAPQMDSIEFFAVRDFFNELELILVDLNTLDRCTDVLEVESIQDHIERNRILTKLRLIAQEIQLS